MYPEFTNIPAITGFFLTMDLPHWTISAQFTINNLFWRYFDNFDTNLDDG